MDRRKTSGGGGGFRIPPGKAVGLALGSGGGRGLAHLGVIRYLHEIGVRPAFIAGTSAGAIVGAACACGLAAELQEISEQSDWKFMAKIFGEVGIHRSGIFTGRHVEKFLRSFLPVSRIEDLDIPFATVATDYRRATEAVIDRGDLIEAVRASISIPGVFTPVRRRGRYLVDGALVNPVPVSVVRKMGADFVIGVDVNLAPGKWLDEDKAPARDARFDRSLLKLRRRFDELIESRPGAAAALESAKEFFAQYRDAPTLVEVLMQTARLAANEMTRARLVSDPPDILVQPPVGGVATLDFMRARPCIRAGYEAARAAFAASLP